VAGQEPRQLLVGGRPPLGDHPPARVQHGQPRRPPPTPRQVHPDEPHASPPPSDDADPAIRYRPEEERSFALTEPVEMQAASAERTREEVLADGDR
jgi:hypothetical protein